RSRIRGARRALRRIRGGGRSCCLLEVEHVLTQAACRYLAVLLFQLDADSFTSEILSGDECGAGAGERVGDGAGRALADELFHHVYWLGVRVPVVCCIAAIS